MLSETNFFSTAFPAELFAAIAWTAFVAPYEAPEIIPPATPPTSAQSPTACQSTCPSLIDVEIAADAFSLF